MQHPVKTYFFFCCCCLFVCFNPVGGRNPKCVYIVYNFFFSFIKIVFSSLEVVVVFEI